MVPVPGTTLVQSIYDSSVASGDTAWLGGATSLQNPNKRFLERSVSQFDIPHVFQFSWVYDLPIGRGKALGTDWNPVVSGIFGGWKFSGSWRMGSGQPIRPDSGRWRVAGRSDLWRPASQSGREAGGQYWPGFYSQLLCQSRSHRGAR